LRGFILDHHAPLLQRTRSGDISTDDEASAGQQRSRRQFDSLGLQLRLDLGAIETDGSVGNLLVLAANRPSSFPAERGYPALNQPLRMGKLARQRRSCPCDRFRMGFESRGGDLAQHRVRKRRG
jgi:hypothetical protein